LFKYNYFTVFGPLKEVFKTKLYPSIIVYKLELSNKKTAEHEKY